MTHFNENGTYGVHDGRLCEWTGGRWVPVRPTWADAPRVELMDDASEVRCELVDGDDLL